MCQATAIERSTKPLRLLDMRQYWREVKYRNSTPAEFIKMALLLIHNKIRRKLGLRDVGAVAGACANTPAETLALKPGEYVKFKSVQEVRETLDPSGKNRGLLFCPEMSRFCGGTYRVLKRVDQIVDEMTGELRPMENTVLLEGVMCDGKSHRGCTRHSYYFCREIWLRRLTRHQQIGLTTRHRR